MMRIRQLRSLSFLLPILGLVSLSPLLSNGQEGNLPRVVLEGAKGDWKGWHLRLEDGVSAASESGKPIFLLFTGSEWCSACDVFEEGILSSEEFAEWAKGVELVVYDLPANYFKSPLHSVVSPIQHRTVVCEGVPHWALLSSDGITVLKKNWGRKEWGPRSSKPGNWVKPVQEHGVSTGDSE